MILITVNECQSEVRGLLLLVPVLFFVFVTGNDNTVELQYIE